VPAALQQMPACAAMDPEARRRACVEFRVKLSRDTGANLTAATCEELCAATFLGEGDSVTLESNPGRFYVSLGEAIEDQTLALVLPDRRKIAWWCFRQAAEVHGHSGGMLKLVGCLYTGRGVTEDLEQAVVWMEKAANLGEPAAKSFLGSILIHGDASAGVAKDAARGFALVREASAQGYGPALFKVAQWYLKGEGVAKDAVHAVTLLWQLIDQGGTYATMAQAELAACYYTGLGVEADTVQAALWCQRAADGGDEDAIHMMLPMIRTCNFCGTRPARQHCERCRKVRYCNTTCQAAHWNRETEPHKGHCRRAAEASQLEAGGASTSAQ